MSWRLVAIPNVDARREMPEATGVWPREMSNRGIAPLGVEQRGQECHSDVKPYDREGERIDFGQPSDHFAVRYSNTVALNSAVPPVR
jgi:hypothetical protein